MKPFAPSNRSSEISLPPAYWNALPQEEKAEFMRLRQNFLQGQKISSKDRRIVTFRKELLIVLKFLERSSENAEERSVLVGVCFAGPYICVNTRQLKSFLGRCKSSINGSFQQLGYVALRTKVKARNIVVAVLPSLQNDQAILRQWTVRCASEDAQFCFLSSFSSIPLPEITDEDLYDEKKPSSNVSPRPSNFQPPIHPISNPIQQIDTYAPPPPQPFAPKKISFDLSFISDEEGNYGNRQYPDLSTSFSVGNFRSFDEQFDDSPSPADSVPQRQNEPSLSMRRSFSASFNTNDTLGTFDDDFDLA